MSSLAVFSPENGQTLRQIATPLSYVILGIVIVITAWFIIERQRNKNSPGRIRPKLKDLRLEKHPIVRKTDKRYTYIIVGLAVVGMISLWRFWVISEFGWTITTYFFLVAGIIVLLFTIGYAFGGDKLVSWAPVRKAGVGLEGPPYIKPSVVAIIPSYNEDQESLNQAINAILDQRVEGIHAVDYIYVVDDGSETPVVEWPGGHERVMWIRQPNAGKREAQATALKQMVADDRVSEYLLTVDSDSRLHAGAVEECLRTFTDKTIMGVTGMIVVRSPKNIISRLIDIEMVCGIFTTRRSRSAIGVVIPCSGALSMYRTFVVLDNLEDYVASGTYSDDRRLSHYCLRYGRCVGIDTAVVDTLMPDTVEGAWKQRVRWYKGYWFYLNTEIKDLKGVSLAIRWWSTITAVVFPLLLLWAIFLPLFSKRFPWEPFALWVGLTYTQNLLYFRRPALPMREKFFSWLLLSPLIPLLQATVIRPAMYWAAWQVFSSGETAGQWDGARLNGNSTTVARAKKRAATQTSRFRPDVEGLRGLALILILLWVARVPFVTGGFVGIDVFFVISGFLVTLSIINEVQGTGTVEVGRFIAKRLTRVIPVLAVVVTLVAALSWVFLPPMASEGAGLDGALGALGLGSVRLDNGMPDLAVFDSPLDHLWVVANYGQFAVVWPLVVALAMGAIGFGWLRNRPIRMHYGMIAVLGALAISLYVSILTRATDGFWYFSVFSRLWEFVLGGLLVFLGAKLTPRPTLYRLLGVGLLVGSAVWLTVDSAYPGFLALVPAVGAALVILAGMSEGDDRVSRALSSTPFQALGRWSFPALLWAVPCVFFAAFLTSVESTRFAWVFLLALGVAVCLGAVTYRFVERPAAAFLGGSSRGRAILLSGAALGVASLVCLSLFVVVHFHLGMGVHDFLPTGMGA